jgi:hypothetical protein
MPAENGWEFSTAWTWQKGAQKYKTEKLAAHFTTSAPEPQLEKPHRPNADPGEFTRRNPGSAQKK